jgi:hypothetical protein
VNETPAALEAVLTRLRKHFERFQAGDSMLASLGALAAPFGLPGAVSSFYSRCDGLDAGLADSVVGQLLSVRGSLEAREDLPEALRESLWPIRADGCGDYDCVVLNVPFCTGAVVFWDHEVYERPSYLLAGSFISYLEMWTDYLVTCYSPSGKLRPEYDPPNLNAWPWIGKPQQEHPWPFDEDYLRGCDDRAAELLRDPQVRSWLSEQAS